eukprot:TRINITY_DN15247_c0_g1_i6.p2 TRINITY_DN15247_c0_g1~~TRINITY_DN15247_c0_g1_i6.p2  ORF type:complete len:142 (-),score=12.73 TRINITY_DN15247_c0_g1_i6:548-973(-)
MEIVVNQLNVFHYSNTEISGILLCSKFSDKVFRGVLLFIKLKESIELIEFQQKFIFKVFNYSRVVKSEKQLIEVILLALNTIVNVYKLNYVPSDPKLSILVKEHDSKLQVNVFNFAKFPEKLMLKFTILVLEKSINKVLSS